MIPEAQSRLKNIPPTMRKTYERAMAGRSRPSAVKSMCQMCMGWAPGCRADIAGCTDPACPLFPYRPYREKT